MSRGQWLVLAAVLVAAYAYFYQGGGWNQNSRYDLTRALVERGSVRIDGYDVNTGDKAIFDGHAYSDKAPGQALTALPPVAIGTWIVRASGADPGAMPIITLLSYVATLFAAGLPTLVAGLSLAWSARHLGASAGGAAFAALAYGLATPAWAYATLLWGHALAAACLMLAFAAALALRGAVKRAVQGGAARPGRRRRALALALGLAAGWAVVTEYPAAGAALVLVALAPRWYWPWVALGALITAAMLGAYNLAAFGSPFHLGYQSVQGFPGLQEGLLGVTSPKRTVLQEILFGTFRGLLPLAPVLVGAPVGLVLLWRDQPASRPAVIAAVLISLYYLLFNASYYYWDGGFSYGPRHIGAALPFLCLGLAPLWTRATHLVRAGLTLLAAGGSALAVMAVSTTVLLPESVRSPIREIVIPAFVRGDLALNHDLFVLRADPSALPTTALERGAWNLGQLAGLSGLLSLVPLGLVWLVLGLVWLGARRAARASAGPATRPGSVRLPVARPPSPG
jgi:hypothetical protein